MKSKFWATVFLIWNPYLQFHWSHNMDNLTSEKNKTEKTFTMQGVIIQKVTPSGATSYGATAWCPHCVLQYTQPDGTLFFLIFIYLRGRSH